MSIPKDIIAAATEATVLKRKIEGHTKELEERKKTIRTWAIEAFVRAVANDPACTMLEVPTKEGTLSVIFPRDKPVVVEGQDLELVFQKLPPEKSSLVVEPLSGFSIVKGFYEAWTAPSPPFTKTEQRLIRKVITFQGQTPRVEPSK